MGFFAHDHGLPKCPPHLGRCPTDIGTETCVADTNVPNLFHCSHADFDGLDAMRISDQNKKEEAMLALVEQTLDYLELMFPEAEGEINSQLVRLNEVRGHFHRA